MSGEAMALNVINKVNSKLQFLYHENNFFGTSTEAPASERVNKAWYPSLTKKIKHRTKTTQSKCIRFSLH